METSSIPHDDIELGDLENDAFIPGGNVAGRKARSQNSFTQWIPSRLLSILENLSRLKLTILLLCTFLAILFWLGLNRPVAVSVPHESLALSEKLAKDLSKTIIPKYVIKYAPLVFLDKREAYFPSDMAIHVASTHAESNFSSIKDGPESLMLNNLDALNALGGEDIYLTSTLSVITRPSYLHGQAPSTKTLLTENATSCVIIIVEKEHDVVDAFYMYFYTMNDGPTALGHQVGSHLGDWEHSMIRFKDGKPKAIWLSQHEYGEGFKWKALTKYEKRPLIYSAKGSHANYAVARLTDLHKNDESIPAHVAYDYTSRGSLWDPTLSAYYYKYSTATGKFTPATQDMPVNYLYFNGKWGDQEYPDGTEGQEKFQGYHKWTGGPQGPLFKHLDREDVCLPNRPVCVLKKSL